MTTIGMTTRQRSRTTWRSRLRTRSPRTTVLARVRRLLHCVTSPTDVLGGLRYDGYSFTSQAVSELMAVGAPSELLVDPLFLVYDVLVVAFGVAVVSRGSGRNSRAHNRMPARCLWTDRVCGTDAVRDAPARRRSARERRPAPRRHGCARPAPARSHWCRGLRIRQAIPDLLAHNACRSHRLRSLTIPFGIRIAAGQPTPGFGIIERINIYLSLSWIAVLAPDCFSIGCLPARSRLLKTATHAYGFVAPGFEEVRDEFERNFAERGEIGAAVAAYWRGEKVVDLWGGRRFPRRRALE